MTQKCQWCLTWFDRDRRSLAEVEALRKVLLIEMTTPFDPPICDSCYVGVMGSARSPAEIAGETAPTTSLGFPNLLLANKMGA